MTHSFKKHYFHLIWSTKERNPWIDKELASCLYPYVGGIIRNYKGSMLSIGGMPDHMHVLFSLGNIENYSYLIRDNKASSSLWIHKNYPKHKSFAWQEGSASVIVS